MRTTHKRANNPNPAPSTPVCEVKTDEYVFLADDLPIIDMVEVSPGIWGLSPLAYHDHAAQ